MGMTDSSNEIPCVYFSSTGEGFIYDVNQVFCDAIGYTKEELTGRKLDTIFTLATRIFIQTHFYPLLQLKGHAEEIYITLRSKAGEDVPVLINATRKERDDVVLLSFAGIRINQRKKFEDEIIAAKKAAEKALAENTALKAANEERQRHAEELDRQITKANIQNQELKQINHLATHSLQEPLRKLLFYSSQVLECETENLKVAAVDKIGKAAENMRAKLNGLQQYVWLTNEELVCENLDLTDLLASVISHVQHENPDVELKIQSEFIPAIEANDEQIGILLTEIFANAIRFRKPGNLVDIQIQANILLINQFRQLPEKYKYSEFLKLQVRDKGVGLDETYQEQAFDLFRTLHPGSGLGIGLALCKKIVDNHNGFISLESVENEGTNVIIFLPLKQF